MPSTPLDAAGTGNVDRTAFPRQNAESAGRLPVCSRIDLSSTGLTPAGVVTPPSSAWPRSSPPQCWRTCSRLMSPPRHVGRSTRQTGLAHLPRRTPDSGGSVELGDADVPPHADRVRLYRNARLPYRSSETSSPTGRRVVGPYLPIGQPRGITAHGVTFHGRPRARLASSLLHSGTVISAAPNPAARAASKRFCTAG